MRSNNIINSLLGCVFILAFLIRIKGIPFGFPIITHPNEPFLIYTAMNMIQFQTLSPHYSVDPNNPMYYFFMYPTFPIYIQFSVYSCIIFFTKVFGGVHDIRSIGLPTFLYWGRMVTVIFSMGVLWCEFGHSLLLL